MEVVHLNQLDFSKVYSYADYLSWKFAERVELIKGYILPMVAPRVVHQQTVTGLIVRIGIHLEEAKSLCRLFTAPFDVRLTKLGTIPDQEVYTVVQPDLCVICDPNKLDEKGCKGAPDLIVEIISPSSLKTDLITKPALYAENGVREYWVVFPNDKIIQQYVLQPDGTYPRNPEIYGEEDAIESVVLEGLRLEIQTLFPKK
jgi:Uma2 family endonuclease